MTQDKMARYISLLRQAEDYLSESNKGKSAPPALPPSLPPSLPPRRARRNTDS
jgi:hypothetical protein